MTANPFLAVVKRLRRSGPFAEHDLGLPACPQCGRPALAGEPWEAWDRLTHDCHCCLDDELAYNDGLRRLWASKMALPHYLAGLPERYARYTFDRIERTPENAPAIDAARRLDRRSLFLHGPAGTGKTMLACATAHAYAASGVTARYWSLNELIGVLRRAAVGEAPTPDLLSVDVLVLDDAGKVKPTGFVYEAIYNCLEGRWSREKTTIITANHKPRVVGLALTPEGDADAASALVSRMGSGLVFEMDGRDARWKGGS